MWKWAGELFRVVLSSLSWSAVIVLAVVADGLHFPFWKMAGILVIYLLGAVVDQKQKRRIRNAVLDDELFNWEVDANDPEYEDKGNLTRIKLTSQNQIMVARVGELLRRTL